MIEEEPPRRQGWRAVWLRP